MPISTGGPKQGQKFQNLTSFRHNKNSRLTKKIEKLPIQNLCGKCHAQMEWRKRYRKYKPLTIPKRCITCLAKTVRDAYHVVCDECTSTNCAKCLGPIVDVPSLENDAAIGAERAALEEIIKGTVCSERVRRTLMRKLERGEMEVVRRMMEIIEASTDKIDLSFSSDEES